VASRPLDNLYWRLAKSGLAMIFSGRHTVAVLLVCTANICRSPMAAGLLRAELGLRGLQRKVRIDSAGTSATQPGHPPDGRAQQVCAREGIDLRRQRARQVTVQDFPRFDFILAMDERNNEWLLENCPDHLKDRVSLLGSWAPGGDIGEIPDPYYGSVQGFEQVLAMLHRAMQGFLPHLENALLERSSRGR